MRILSVGDLHYNIPQFDWLANAADKFDHVIIVGDLLNIASAVAIDNQILVVQKYLNRIKQRTHLVVCSGNHDGDRKASSGEYFADWLGNEALRDIDGDGASVTIGNWRFSICPWWDGPVAKEKVEAFLDKEAEEAPDNWFVVHHAPPSETKTAWTGKRDCGDALLRELILRHPPRIVLSGHVHQAPFRGDGSWYDRIGDTWVFNAGYQMGQLPPYLEFDLDAGNVRWISLEGVEALSFAKPVS